MQPPACPVQAISTAGCRDRRRRVMRTRLAANGAAERITDRRRFAGRPATPRRRCARRASPATDHDRGRAVRAVRQAALFEIRSHRLAACGPHGPAAAADLDAEWLLGVPADRARSRRTGTSNSPTAACRVRPPAHRHRTRARPWPDTAGRSWTACSRWAGEDATGLRVAAGRRAATGAGHRGRVHRLESPPCAASMSLPVTLTERRRHPWAARWAGPLAL